MPTATSMKGKRKELPFAVYDGETYKPGDCVLINPDAAASAYVARIKRLFQLSSNPNDVELEVTWFYRPEEAIGGRKAFHGESEVFDSDHIDRAPLGSILGRCTVHSVTEYEALRERHDTDFYWRFKYKPKTKQFEPDRVPVYCLCELPYNPDKPMVMCDECDDWFHPQCLHMGQEILDKETFTCPNCAAAWSAKRQRVMGPDSAAGAC